MSARVLLLLCAGCGLLDTRSRYQLPEPESTFELPGAATDIAISQDGTRLYASVNGRSAYTLAGTPVGDLDYSAGTPIAPAGSFFYTPGASTGEGPALFDSNGRLLTKENPQRIIGAGIAPRVSADGTTAVAIGQTSVTPVGYSIKRLTVGATTATAIASELHSGDTAYTDAALSVDGGVLLVAPAGGGLLKIDLATATAAPLTALTGKRVTSLHWPPGGGAVVTVDQEEGYEVDPLADVVTVLWTANADNFPRVIAHGGHRLARTPDGKTLFIIAATDLLVMDVAMKTTVHHPLGAMTALALQPDGKKLFILASGVVKRFDTAALIAAPGAPR